MRSMQQRKWVYLAEAANTQTCFAKKEFWNIRQTHWNRLQACKFSKKIILNKPFSVNGCKHLWTAASDLDKYLTSLTTIFDSEQNTWSFGLWSNLTTVVRAWCCFGFIWTWAFIFSWGLFELSIQFSWRYSHVNQMIT